MDIRLIERRFWGTLGFLPGFGKAITFASFPDMGKCESQMELKAPVGSAYIASALQQHLLYCCELNCCCNHVMVTDRCVAMCACLIALLCVYCVVT
jgi:hypothetical protein